MLRAEEQLQLAVCKYLDFKYPNLIYFCDMSGVKVSKAQAGKSKMMRCKRYKVLDLLILHPTGQYHGLMIEIKASKDQLYQKRNGEYLNNDHIKGQLETIIELNRLGYYATFACGIDECIKIIDNYFK
jgi:hypothetical protein